MTEKYVRQRLDVVTKFLDEEFVKLRKQYPQVKNVSLLILTSERICRMSFDPSDPASFDRAMDNAGQTAFTTSNSHLLRTGTEDKDVFGITNSSKIVFNKTHIIIMIRDMTLAEIKEYLLKILKHEFGHALAYRNEIEEYSSKGDYIAAYEHAARQKKLYHVQLSALHDYDSYMDMEDIEYAKRYYTDIDDERKANEAIGISFEDMKWEWCPMGIYGEKK